MKKIKILFAFLTMFSAMIFVSCETEPVDPVLNENQGENPGTNPGTSEGDYFPMAVNNQWVFSDNGVAMEPMKIVGTETVNSSTYYKVDQFFTNAGTAGLTGSAKMLLRKNGGEYSVRVSVQIPEEEGVSITVSPFEFTFLKDNLAAGATWTQDVTQTTTMELPGTPIPPVVMTIKFTGTILEKNVTAEVNGETYNDVIKVKLTQQVMASPTTPSDIEISTEMWFSKNIGPIKSQTNEGGVNTNQVLESYIIN